MIAVEHARIVDRFLHSIHRDHGAARIVRAEHAHFGDGRGLSSAIAHYFNYRSGTLERDLRDLLRTGRRSLGVGLAVLAVCVFIAQLLRLMLPGSPLAQALAEGLTIFGWVANWRPAEIFLYDVWAARRRIDLYRRIAQADVELRAFG